MVSYSKHKQTDSDYSSNTLITGKGNSLPSVSVLQKKPAAVHGLTHLVEKKGNSIYNGDEKDEVTALDTLDVNPDVRIRSRRGPNQEMVGDYDRRGEHIYRWFRVDEKPAGVNISEKNWYIREDTFDFTDKKDLPKLKDLSSLPDKRTRQSHVAVRFEAWFNSNYFTNNIPDRQNLDLSGHMVMKDYWMASQKQKPYIAYEMQSKKHPREIVGGTRDKNLMNTDSLVENHDKDGIKVEGMPKSTYWGLGTMNESEEEITSRLKAQERFKPADKWIKEGEKGTGVKRFDKKKWVEILVSMDEYRVLTNMFQQRGFENQGFYCFVREARTTLNYELATRCLSVIEDIALQRGLDNLETGHAKEVINHFAELENVTEKHQGEEDV